MFTCSETPEVQNKEPAGTGMHRTLLCSCVSLCKQQLQNALHTGGDWTPPECKHCSEGRKCLSSSELQVGFKKTQLFPVWLLGGFFFACFSLSLGILLALQPR